MGLRGVRLHTSSVMMKMIRSSPCLRYLLDSGVFIGSIFQSNVEVKMEGGLSVLPYLSHIGMSYPTLTHS